MVIFINEDRAYAHWVTHHRNGFVIDGRHQPRIAHLVLHRATCDAVKQSKGKHSHSTTAGRLKAWAQQAKELEDWAMEQNVSVKICDQCRPGDAAAVDETSPAHLTKLAHDVLDYVLEAALIHFEHDHPPYRLCIGDIAACFAKTPGQLRATLSQLLTEGLIVSHGGPAKGDPLGPKVLVFPTIAALRREEALRDESEEDLQSELQKLHA